MTTVIVDVDVSDDDMPEWLEIVIGVCTIIFAILLLICMILTILWCCGCLHPRTTHDHCDGGGGGGGCCDGGGRGGRSDDYSESEKGRRGARDGDKDNQGRSQTNKNKVDTVNKYYTKESNVYLVEDNYGYPYHLYPAEDSKKTKYNTTDKRRVEGGENVKMTRQTKQTTVVHIVDDKKKYEDTYEKKTKTTKSETNTKSYATPRDKKTTKSDDEPPYEKKKEEKKLYSTARDKEKYTPYDNTPKRKTDDIKDNKDKQTPRDNKTAGKSSGDDEMKVEDIEKPTEENKLNTPRDEKPTKTDDKTPYEKKKEKNLYSTARDKEKTAPYDNTPKRKTDDIKDNKDKQTSRDNKTAGKSSGDDEMKVEDIEKPVEEQKPARKSDKTDNSPQEQKTVSDTRAGVPQTDKDKGDNSKYLSSNQYEKKTKKKPQENRKKDIHQKTDETKTKDVEEERDNSKYLPPTQNEKNTKETPQESRKESINQKTDETKKRDVEEEQDKPNYSNYMSPYRYEKKKYEKSEWEQPDYSNYVSPYRYQKSNASKSKKGRKDLGKAQDSNKEIQDSNRETKYKKRDSVRYDYFGYIPPHRNYKPDDDKPQTDRPYYSNYNSPYRYNRKTNDDKADTDRPGYSSPYRYKPTAKSDQDDDRFITPRSNETKKSTVPDWLKANDTKQGTYWKPIEQRPRREPHLLDGPSPHSLAFRKPEVASHHWYY